MPSNARTIMPFGRIIDSSIPLLPKVMRGQALRAVRHMSFRIIIPRHSTTVRSVATCLVPYGEFVFGNSYGISTNNLSHYMFKIFYHDHFRNIGFVQDFKRAS